MLAHSPSPSFRTASCISGAAATSTQSRQTSTKTSAPAADNAQEENGELKQHR